MGDDAVVKGEAKARRAVEVWAEALNAALVAKYATAVEATFSAEPHWRNLAALDRGLATVSGAATAGRFYRAAMAAGAQNFRIDPARFPPRQVERAGRAVFEAIIAFDIAGGGGEGVVRLDAEGGADHGRAWILLTALDHLDALEEIRLRPKVEDEPFARDFHGPNWLDRREAACAYADRDPQVLIIGGGHAGITAAARLTVMGVDALIVDRMTRIGDNWRLRYHSLALHNEKYSNHMPYLPFPETWPKYIPKDKIANWLEHYVEIMELNFWTETSFEGAVRDEAAGVWEAELTLSDGTRRTMRPKHIIMATSVSGTPKIPEIPTLDRFEGQVVHSSAFESDQSYKGRKVTIIGVGTSAHDIAQQLEGGGAEVTMVQRSPSTIVNIDPGAQRFDAMLLTDGPCIEDRILLNLATPLEPMKVAHKMLTDMAREDDKELLEALEKVGFRLDFGEGGTGWPLKYRTRGGGYYFNVGASNLVAEGRIGLLQYADIEAFTPTGAQLKDGRAHDADVIVLATGYQGLDHMVRMLFGDPVAERVGQIWGFDDNQELSNMWKPTPQDGLWFTAGAYSQCTAFSKFLGLQIAADVHGARLPGSPAPDD